MSQGHDHSHDDHKADDHGHGAGNSHDAHGSHGSSHDTHGDDHGSHGGHDEHGHGGGHDDHGGHGSKKGGHWDHGHDDHWHGWHGHDEHEEEDEIFDPIESAGIVNDLSFDLEPIVDVTSFFAFSEVMTIQHSQGPAFTDLAKAGTNQSIDLSKPLVLRITRTDPRPKIADIYPNKRYEPKLFTLGDIDYAPRFRTINLYDPLPEVPENSLDIRTSAVIENTVTYPDLYPMPMTPARRIRMIRRKHGRRIARTAIGVALGGIVFMVGLVSLTVMAKNDIVAGYAELTQLSPNGEPAQVRERIVSINRHFTHASLYFIPMKYLISSGIIANETVVNGYHALYAGTAVSELLSDADATQSDFAAAYTGTGQLQGYLDPKMVVHGNIPLTDYFKAHRDRFSNMARNISQAQYHFSSITTTGDVARDAELTQLTGVLKSLESVVAYASDHGEELLKVLGDKKPMNYLVLNQNRDELRANGGFPGSVVEVSFYKGRLEKYEKKDIYFYDWHLFPYGETPPPGIDQIAKAWGMRDANYSPDIRESFTTISRMYEKAGGSTLDGMVAINQGLIEDLLAVTGPVRVLGVPDQIDSQSFSTLMSVLVEGQYGRQATAKDILFLTISAIENRISEAKKYDQYLDVIKKNVEEGQVLVAMRDDANQAFTDEIFGKPAYIANPNNFIYPVFTSLSGNKSDRYVERTFDLSILSQTGCTVTNRMELTSTHAFSVAEREKIRRMLYQYGVDSKEHEHELYVQWNGDNVQFIRLLLPKGSAFVGISKEFENTFKWNTEHPEYDEVSFTVTTGVGKTTQMHVDYTSTPQSCNPAPKFIEQPGLQHFQVRYR